MPGLRERITMKKGHELYKAQKYDEAIKKYKESSSWTRQLHRDVPDRDVEPGHVPPGLDAPEGQEYASQSIEYLEKLMTLPAPDKETQRGSSSTTSRCSLRPR